MAHAVIILRFSILSRPESVTSEIDQSGISQSGISQLCSAVLFTYTHYSHAFTGGSFRKMGFDQAVRPLWSTTSTLT